MKLAKNCRALLLVALAGSLMACQKTAEITEQASKERAETPEDERSHELQEVVLAARHVGAPQDAPAKLSKATMLLSQPLPEGYYYPQDLVQHHNREHYRGPNDNPIRSVLEQPFSTFSVDVDSASYANIRRMIMQEGNLPPKQAVRVEEMLNYFHYRYPKPSSAEQAFHIETEVSASPWNKNKYLMRVGLQGFEPKIESRPAANLVFLVDVSGSMQAKNKLPLLKKSLLMLVDKLEVHDKVAIVAYAGAAGLVLETTPAAEKATIRQAINALRAGGSTHGSAGIQLAYQQAQKAFIEEGINRVIIASDGDMNVGITDIDQLKNLIEKKRKSGIALSTLGFGTGNYNDALMEELADIGNGNAAYIDSLKEAYKVLVQQMNATLYTLAHDAKIQIEFNPEQVSEYRLVGYENRLLNSEDFTNDKVDAGDIGLGHQVSAIYEFSVKGQGSLPKKRYASEHALSKKRPHHATAELAYIKLRYKPAQGAQSRLIEKLVYPQGLATAFNLASAEHRFAVSVAEFGQRLRGTKYINKGSYEQLIKQLRDSKGSDPFSYRGELISMVELAASLERQVALQ